MNDVAVCIPVFKRTKDITRLLNTLPDWAEHVYIADDGDKQDERQELYEQDYGFDLTVYSLDYNAGVSAKRNVLLQYTTEPYLLYLDSDHVAPTNTPELLGILETNPELGGVSGAIVEPETPDYNLEGQFFTIDGNTLIRSPHRPRRLRHNKQGDNHLFYFDFIANAVLFRRDCLLDYSWDDTIKVGREHVDFYLGHYITTTWEFAVSPNVIFMHYRGSGGDDYESFRYDTEQIREYERYVLEKWGLDEDVVEDYRWRKLTDNETLYFLDELDLWQKAVVIGVCDGPGELVDAIKSRYQ